MRFLKNKVAQAQIRLGIIPKECLSEDEHELFTDQINLPGQIEGQNTPFQEPLIYIVPLTAKVDKSAKEKNKIQSKAQSNSARNVVKNFGRAISSFCISEIALLYLEPIIAQKNVDIKDFQGFILARKESIDGIASFRNLLLATENDSRDVQAYKQVTQEMSVVFIKYFSVNWIFNSRMKDRIAHLNCRYKMLRRVMDPQHFTYLKACN